jgi:hypothetical protein
VSELSEIASFSQYLSLGNCYIGVIIGCLLECLFMAMMEGGERDGDIVDPYVPSKRTARKEVRGGFVRFALRLRIVPGCLSIIVCSFGVFWTVVGAYAHLAIGTTIGWELFLPFWFLTGTFFCLINLLAAWCWMKGKVFGGFIANLCSLIPLVVFAIYLEMAGGGEQTSKEIINQVNASGTITDEQAETLGKIEMFSLDGLTSITDEQAESLSKLKLLHLDGLTSITDEQAESLSKIEWLHLNGLTSITDTMAESLSKTGDLHLNGLTSITDKQAQSLARVKVRLFLNGLSSITNEQAESLSNIKGQLRLSGLTSITDAQAESLSKVEILDLGGLTSITDTQTKISNNGKGLIIIPTILPTAD